MDTGQSSSQDFRLTWVNYSQKLTESFHKFLTSEILCNVTLWVHSGPSQGGHSIKAHQAILSACSPWFEEVLSQSQHPHPVIILKDVRLQDLKNIIRFIYTGEVFVPQNELQDFLKTAELLEIKGLLRDADDPSWSNLSSLFPAPPAPVATPLLAPSAATTPASLIQHISPQPQTQKFLNIINSAGAGPQNGQPLLTANPPGTTTILPSLPTVPVSSVFLPSPAPTDAGASQINDLVSQIKVPVSFSSCQLPTTTAKMVPADGIVTAGDSQTSSTLNSVLNSNKKRKTSLTKTTSGLQVLANQDLNNPQQILQIHQRSLTDGLLTTTDNSAAGSIKRQRILSNQPNLEMVETQLVVSDQGPNGEGLLTNDDDEAVSWIEDVSPPSGSTGSTNNNTNNNPGSQTGPPTNSISSEGSTTHLNSQNNDQQPQPMLQQQPTLTPAEWVATGINDCGAFKRLWAERYLCYNLGREIICLLCFCRFTQFKKFNLERHMKNKHPQMLNLSEASRREILERYVGRYITHVTSCGNTLTTPAAAAANLETAGCDNLLTGGQHDVASEILSIGPIQLEDVNTGHGIGGGEDVGGILQGGIRVHPPGIITTVAPTTSAVFSSSLQNASGVGINGTINGTGAPTSSVEPLVVIKTESNDVINSLPSTSTSPPVNGSGSSRDQENKMGTTLAVNGNCNPAHNPGNPDEGPPDNLMADPDEDDDGDVGLDAAAENELLLVK